MAQSDIKYSKVSDEDQGSGNPDPISMFKSLLGGGQPAISKQESGSEQELQPMVPPAPAPSSSASSSDSAGATAAALNAGSSVVRVQEQYSNLTEEQRERAKAHHKKMEALIEEKLSKMSPEEKEVFKKKQAMMEKAVMAQMQMAKSGALPTSPPPPPAESVAEFEDRKLLFAIRTGQVEELEKLLTEFNRNVNCSAKAPNDQEGHPLLHWAALNDQKEILEYMVNKNVDIDQRNPRGEVALHWASLNGNLRAVHLLIDSGCDRTASDARGYSALHHAAQFGRTVVLACLHRRGLNVDIRDNNGRNPLIWAAYKGEDMALQWLIDHGADISCEDFESCTAIHWAALQGLYSTSAVLVKNGAIPLLSKKDRTGMNPAELARDKQSRYQKDSYQFKSYKRVADYLETCQKKKQDVAKMNKRSKHPTWYAWPIMAPIGFWQYYTVVFPETYYYPIPTLLFWVFFFAEWVSWTMLQLSDPGNYVTPLERKSKVTPTDDEDETADNNDTRISIQNEDFCVTKVNPGQPDAQELRDLYKEALDNGLLVPVCTTCEIAKPLRSKHDRFTDVCIAKFDHFCPFMGVAVGENNYRLFFFSMFNAMIAMWSWIYMVVQYTKTYNRTKGYWTNVGDTIGWQVFAWSYFPIALYATLMVGQHLLFIKRNITTNEVINRYRYRYLANKQNPYDRGTLSNFVEFFGFNEPVKVDLRQYYKYFLDGRSEQVERNNNELLYGPKKLTSATSQGGGSCGHNHSHGGGHGHSHGGHGHSH